MILKSEKQTLYRFGVGKAMHMMQYSRPDTYNAVCDLARHMTSATQVHMDAMVRLMKYMNSTRDRGWRLTQCKSGMEVKTTSLSLAKEVIPTMQKTRRPE